MPDPLLDDYIEDIEDVLDKARRSTGSVEFEADNVDASGDPRQMMSELFKSNKVGFELEAIDLSADGKEVLVDGSLEIQSSEKLQNSSITFENPDFTWNGTNGERAGLSFAELQCESSPSTNSITCTFKDAALPIDDIKNTVENELNPVAPETKQDLSF